MEKEKKLEIGGILAGINVILVGLYLMLGMTGVVMFSYLPALLRLWPVILIAIGLDIIFKSFNIRHVGSIVMTVFLILSIIASVPGPTGTGVRRIFGMPEEPTGWDLDRIIKSWTTGSGMKAVETIEENRAIAFVPTRFAIKLEGNVRSLHVSIKKGDIPSCKIKTEILDQVAHYELDPIDPNLTGTTNPDERIFTIDQIDSKGKFCNVYIEAAFADTTNVEVDANLEYFEIIGNWQGNVDLGSTASCNVKTGNLGGFTIKSASGEIEIGDCKSASIETISSDVKTGSLQDKSKISSASGEIGVGMAGEIEAATISGNISIAEVSGKAKIKSVSGEIMIGKVADRSSLTAETTSGNITIPELGSIASGNIKSISGNIDAMLSKVADLTINVDTLSGHMDIAGFEKMPEAGFDRSMVVGEGTGRLEIGTTSGNIEVKQ